MKPISDEQELVRQLACKGEPLAFYRLFSEQFRARYLDLRRSSIAHPDALGAIIELSVQLYRKKYRERPGQSPQDWFDQNAPSPGVSALPPDEYDLVSSTDLASWTENEQLITNRLLHEYGNQRRKRQRNKISRPPRYSIFIIIVVLFALFAGFSVLQMRSALLRKNVVIALGNKRIRLAPLKPFEMLFSRPIKPPSVLPAVVPDSLLAKEAITDSSDSGTVVAPALKKAPASAGAIRPIPKPATVSRPPVSTQPRPAPAPRPATIPTTAPIAPATAPQLSPTRSPASTTTAPARPVVPPQESATVQTPIDQTPASDVQAPKAVDTQPALEQPESAPIKETVPETEEQQ